MKKINFKNHFEIHNNISNSGTFGILIDWNNKENKLKIIDKYNNYSCLQNSFIDLNSKAKPKLSFNFYGDLSQIKNEDKRIFFFYISSENDSKLNFYIDFNNEHVAFKKPHINVRIVNNSVFLEEIKNIVNHKIKLEFNEKNNILRIDSIKTIINILKLLGEKGIFKDYLNYNIYQLEKSSIVYEELNKLLSKYIKE